jgi:hypothetical protein
MMPRIVMFTLLATLVVTGCPRTEAPETPPSDISAHTNAQEPESPPTVAIGEPQHDMGLNTDLELDEAVRNAWNGVILEVGEPEGPGVRYELVKGAATALGDTGLTATLIEFVPDFEMGEGGITSRSNEANNPAARVRIVEEGRPEYVGWLFAEMPAIHPFPHETYKVVLIEGVSKE